jgi:hypothetical protein
VPLLEKNGVRKLHDLAKMHLKGKAWEPIMKRAHDALSDCLLLDGLIAKFSVSDATVKECAVTMRSYLEKQVRNRNRKSNAPELKVLQEYGISKIITGRMACSGVSMEELKREYALHGREGLNVCLGVQLNGKPRVTTSKKIVDCVEKALVTLNSL